MAEPGLSCAGVACGHRPADGCARLDGDGAQDRLGIYTQTVLATLRKEGGVEIVSRGWPGAGRLFSQRVLMRLVRASKQTWIWQSLNGLLSQLFCGKHPKHPRVKAN